GCAYPLRTVSPSPTLFRPEAYDAALALVPTHRDALLGRVVTLSHLSRHDDAIAAATRIIELGSWFTGEAYYWRAWNEYHVVRVEDRKSTRLNSSHEWISYA